MATGESVERATLSTKTLPLVFPLVFPAGTQFGMTTYGLLFCKYFSGIMLSGSSLSQ
jgi:hypothetical protein